MKNRLILLSAATECCRALDDVFGFLLTPEALNSAEVKFKTQAQIEKARLSIQPLFPTVNHPLEAEPLTFAIIIEQLRAEHTFLNKFLRVASRTDDVRATQALEAQILRVLSRLPAWETALKKDFTKEKNQRIAKTKAFLNLMSAIWHTCQSSWNLDLIRVQLRTAEEQIASLTPQKAMLISANPVFSARTISEIANRTIQEIEEVLSDLDKNLSGAEEQLLSRAALWHGRIAYWNDATERVLKKEAAQ